MRLCTYGCGRLSIDCGFERGQIGKIECQALTISRLNTALNVELKLRADRETAIVEALKWRDALKDSNKRDAELRARLARIRDLSCGDSDE